MRNTQHLTLTLKISHLMFEKCINLNEIICAQTPHGLCSARRSLAAICSTYTLIMTTKGRFKKRNFHQGGVSDFGSISLICLFTFKHGLNPPEFQTTFFHPLGKSLKKCGKCFVPFRVIQVKKGGTHNLCHFGPKFHEL